MMNLRSYQNEAVDAVIANWRDGNRRTLLNMATGTGKTICFSSVISRSLSPGDKALVLAHRGELLSQARDKIMSSCNLDCALEKAESHAYDSLSPVVVGSVQSLCNQRRLAYYPQDHFKVIVVDEAHHTLSPSYMTILEHFNKANVLGVTATPDRTDKKNLGQFYDSMAYEYPLAKAVSDGWLCPIKAQMIPLELDISSVAITNGDYSAGDLGNALEPYLNRIAAEMKTHCQGRKTVVFLPLVSTSQRFCSLLNEMGMKAVEVNGKSEDRDEILKAFEAGEYDILCNSMLLTEGWDCPAVDCIVCLRPTRSRSLYQQIVGRGTRLYPGKTELLLLDFLWLSERHDLCRPSSLVSPNAVITEKIDQMVGSGGPVDLMEAEDEAEKSVVAEREAALARELEALRTRKRQLVDPIQFAVSLSDEALMSYEPTFAWEMEPPTEKQLKFIENCGIDPETVMNKGHAGMIITRIKSRLNLGLSTAKQIRLLERYGFVQVGTWSVTDATAMIGRLSSNGWRLPYGFDPKAYRPVGGAA